MVITVFITVLSITYHSWLSLLCFSQKEMEEDSGGEGTRMMVTMMTARMMTDGDEEDEARFTKMRLWAV